MMRLGLHVSISPTLDKAADYGREKACKTIQVFARNPRGWRLKPLAADDCELLKSKLKAYGIAPLIVHSSYLPNLASPYEALYERSIHTVGEEIVRADAMGAEFYVTHVGHHKGAGPEAGAKRVIKAITRIIADKSPKLMILLENTADLGRSVGESIEQLKVLITGVKPQDKVGLCLDTCHAFAHGYNVADPKGLDDLIKLIDGLIGLDRLKCVHLNDSIYPFGSHMDRHEHIGQGRIGEDGFRVILRHPVIRGLPGILETPVDKPSDDLRNMATIRRLAEEQQG